MFTENIRSHKKRAEDVIPKQPTGKSSRLGSDSQDSGCNT